MTLEETISSIECSATIAELQNVLHDVAARYGFSGFNFLDIGRATDQRPFYFGTSGKQWEEEYANNNFISVDPCLRAARISNVPFRWDEIELQNYGTGRKRGAARTMEAALEHGFTDGVVIPHHFVDIKGISYSAVVVFFWKDAVSKLIFRFEELHTDLHIIVIYWINKLISLRKARGAQATILKPRQNYSLSASLTDREQDILSWAARGKTNSETAEILTIAEQTVEFHLRNASRKLDAINKTHAVALALTLGLINI